MPFVTITAEDWNVILTTTTDTAFQNRDSRPIWVTTEDTTSADLDEGVELQPGDAIIIGAGNDVEASCLEADARLLYLEVGVPAA